MRATEITLNEVANNPYDYELDQDGAQFIDKDGNSYSIKFMRIESGVFAVAFSSGIFVDQKTNRHDSFRIFATVIDAIKSYATKNQVAMIVFSANKSEPNRVNLYKKLALAFTRNSNYKLIEHSKEITDNTLKDRIQYLFWYLKTKDFTPFILVNRKFTNEQSVAEGSNQSYIFYRGEPILSPDRLEQLKSSIGKPYPILRKEGSPSHIGTYMLPDPENAEGYVKQALAGKGEGGTVTKIEVDVNSFKNGDGGVDQAVIITNIAGLVSKQDPDPNDPLRINDRKKSMVYYLGPGVEKYLNDPYLNDPELVKKWYDPEFAKRMWDIIKSGKQAVIKPGENQIQERMIKILGPLAEKIRRDPEVINYFLRHSPKDWVERNFRMNSDGSGTKVIDVQYFPPVKKQGVAEDLEQEFEFELDTEKGRLNVYNQYGGPAGRIEFYPTNSKTINIDLIIVQPQYQRKGLGTQMYMYLKNRGYKIKKPTEVTPDGKQFFGKLKQKGVAEGKLTESAIFLNSNTVIVGQEHGKPLSLSPETLKKVQSIAAKHGAWYEGNGADRAFTRGQIDQYEGSWDDEVAQTASVNDPKWLYVLFANVDANNRVQRVGINPQETIFNRLLANATENSFQGIGFTPQALQKFLSLASEGKHDFVKMSQLPATKKNLTRFLKTGEALMWPSNWEQYPNRAGKIAKAATVDVRDQYLATRKSGVYVTGSGHLKAVQNITGQQSVAEAKYAGNIGIMELIKFFQSHPELKSEYDEIKREKGAIEAMNFALNAINAELEGEPYSVAEDQTEDENITVQNNVETSFRGGYGGTLIAKTPDRQVGYLNYSIYNDKPQIGMIFVAQDYRRRGVAMKMLKALQELSPNEEIDWGITTDAGSNLRKSINYRKVPNPEIIKKKAKLAGVRSKLARLNYRLEQLKNTDVELARKFINTVGDRWNQLNDLEYRLENELYLDKGEYSKLIPENKYIKVLKK